MGRARDGQGGVKPRRGSTHGLGRVLVTQSGWPGVLLERRSPGHLDIWFQKQKLGGERQGEGLGGPGPKSSFRQVNLKELGICRGFAGVPPPQGCRPELEISFWGKSPNLVPSHASRLPWALVWVLSWPGLCLVPQKGYSNCLLSPQTVPHTFHR